MEFTYDRGHDGSGRQGGVSRVIASWESDGDGDDEGTTVKLVGHLVKAITVPGAETPTDQYDITITDENGVDVLGGVQTDLSDQPSASTKETYLLVEDANGTPGARSLHPAVCETLTVSVSNAGDSKSGTLILYYV